LAAYVDGTLASDATQRLETHLADCDACLSVVGLLSRERDLAGTSADAVPELAMARARALVQSKQSRWSRWAPHLAAAAVVLVTISALTSLLQLQGPGIAPDDGGGDRPTRSTSPRAAELQVLYPTAGVTLEPDELRFRWSAVPGSRYYEVRIVSDAGDLVREERVYGTAWQPPERIDLQPGAEYYVQVDAFPADAKAVSSEHVPFRIAAQP
jgi:hypothetical protein